MLICMLDGAVVGVREKIREKWTIVFETELFSEIVSEDENSRRVISTASTTTSYFFTF